jgi:hypothetical protein
MSKGFDELCKATQLLEEQALDRHRRVLDERNRLEQEMAQIEELRRKGQSDGDSLPARRAIGADTLWQGWVMQRRAEVLQRSALCRAREEASFALAQQSFARHRALEALALQERQKQRNRSLQKQAQTLEALGLLSKAIGKG